MKFNYTCASSASFASRIQIHPTARLPAINQGSDKVAIIPIPLTNGFDLELLSWLCHNDSASLNVILFERLPISSHLQLPVVMAHDI
eukprot:6210918-Pleurochrysis_carterae.AAC.2